MIASLKSNLLVLLSFTRSPTTTGPAYVPESLRKFYLHQNSIRMLAIAKTGINARSANTFRTFYHVKSELENKFRHKNKFRLLFDLQNLPLNEKIRAAELSFSRIATKEERKNIIIPKQQSMEEYSFCDIVRPRLKRKSSSILRLIYSKVIDLRKNTTVNLDVYPAHSIYEQTETLMLNRPTLLTYMDDNKLRVTFGKGLLNRRAKRAALRKNRRKDDQENSCRHLLYVDFVDVAWND
ncbi:hypothetical protein M0804_015198 [Polistes exclamans]|nr:hypothetical protein M0804_015198 [Polistes exclamans]